MEAQGLSEAKYDAPSFMRRLLDPSYIGKFIPCAGFALRVMATVALRGVDRHGRTPLGGPLATRRRARIATTSCC